MTTENKYIFGPVPSRRLGLSLGVDIVPLKICSFDCIYCQLGRTTRKTIKRVEYVQAEKVLKELEASLKDSPIPDYITFSGSGEPTLNSKIGKIISEIKKISSVPVAVLTNASRFIHNVRDDLYKADLVLPSLDAVSQDIFEKINRPHERLRIEHIIANLKIFCKYFQGKTWLEVMLVKGINDSREELTKMAELLKEISLDKIQLNTVTRPPSEPDALALSQAELESIKNILGDKAEIIGGFESAQGGRLGRTGVYSRNIEDSIITLLKRRPCTMSDMSSSLGIHRNELTKYLGEMERAGKVESFLHATQMYFQVLV
ncbi:radical SAM protein [bacterium]|nr:radical SAM protein [bacterium]